MSEIPKEAPEDEKKKRRGDKEVEKSTEFDFGWFMQGRYYKINKDKRTKMKRQFRETQPALFKVAMDNALLLSTGDYLDDPDGTGKPHPLKKLMEEGEITHLDVVSFLKGKFKDIDSHKLKEMSEKIKTEHPDLYKNATEYLDNLEKNR